MSCNNESVITAETLGEAFSPDGIFGRRAARYTSLVADDKNVCLGMASYMKSYAPADGSFAVSDIHPYHRFIKRRTFFRPTDEIWAFSGIIADTRKLSGIIDYYADDVAALKSRCFSFAIDTDAFGSSYERIAKSHFFVLPAGSRKALRLAAVCPEFRKCGLITSDMSIRFFGSITGNDVSVPYGDIASGESKKRFISGNAADTYSDGFIAGFADVIASLSPHVLVSGNESKRVTGYYTDNAPCDAVYALGYSACVSHFSDIRGNAVKKPVTDAEGLYYAVIPAEEPKYGSRKTDAIIHGLSRISKDYGCFAVYCTDTPMTVTGYDTVMCQNEPQGLCVAVITDRPLEGHGVQVGRLTKAAPLSE